jgi:hypothetical protein
MKAPARNRMVRLGRTLLLKKADAIILDGNKEEALELSSRRSVSWIARPRKASSMRTTPRAASRA